MFIADCFSGPRRVNGLVRVCSCPDNNCSQSDHIPGHLARWFKLRLTDWVKLKVICQSSQSQGKDENVAKAVGATLSECSSHASTYNAPEHKRHDDHLSQRDCATPRVT